MRLVCATATAAFRPDIAVVDLGLSGARCLEGLEAEAVSGTCSRNGSAGRMKRLRVTQHWPVVVPLAAWLGGLVVALPVGAVAGIYPAVRAARLTPVGALTAP